MSDVIVFTDTLAKMSGLKRPRDIEKWCEKKNIRYFPGKAGPSTTLDALNSALGISLLPDKTDEIII